jgi:demethylmenaquinone methyltransferase/2-methoxy-6-polyprenyl-1,4-benzoquinol methylase
MNSRQGHIIDGFNLLAPAYDTAADVISLGLHRRWRNLFCQTFLKKMPHNGKLLDVGTGTGENLFRSMIKRPDIKAFGLDLSSGMLKIAKEKSEKQPLFFKDKIEFKLGNAFQLPYEANSFDIVTISWSIRNLNPIQGALREAVRVLKPNGYLYILDHGLPELKKVRKFIHKYASHVPVLGAKVTQSQLIYDPIYTTSVEGFSPGKNFAAELFDAGFTKVQYKTYSGGFIYIYSAQKANR